MTQRTCGVSGCAKPHRARGLCSSHYNQQHQPDRHRKSTVTCGYCGKPTLKHTASRYAERFCSLACRDAWRKATDNNPAPPGKDQCAVSWRTCPDCGIEWFSHLTLRKRCTNCDARRDAERRVIKPRWVAGWCRRCGTAFVDVWLGSQSAQYCSASCLRSDHKAKRRAMKRNAYVADVWRQRIFERDGWRCQLCNKLVDRTAVVPQPKAPVLDHIVPLAKGGTHEPRNVQCAHFICNSIKGDRGYGEQLLLIG